MTESVVLEEFFTVNILQLEEVELRGCIVSVTVPALPYHARYGLLLVEFSACGGYALAGVGQF